MYRPAFEATPPEVDPTELDKMESPDVVKIVERQVNEYETIKRQRLLRPEEERERARFIEFLIKIEVTKLESRDKPQQNDDWIEREMEKVRSGFYDTKPAETT